MNKKQFVEQLRLKTGTDSDTLTKEKITTLVNGEIEGYAILATLPNLNETYLSKATTVSLVADTRSYDIPDDVIKIQRIEFMYD